MRLKEPEERNKINGQIGGLKIFTKYKYVSNRLCDNKRKVKINKKLDKNAERP